MKQCHHRDSWWESMQRRERQSEPSRSPASALRPQYVVEPEQRPLEQIVPSCKRRACRRLLHDSSQDLKKAPSAACFEYSSHPCVKSCEDFAFLCPHFDKLDAALSNLRQQASITWRRQVAVGSLCKALDRCWQLGNAQLPRAYWAAGLLARELATSPHP